MPELPPDLSRLSLEDIAARIADEKLPPVASWNPPLKGHSHIRIARDGCWFHEGSPINRENLVRLFATILRREGDGSFVLVTPVEKMRVDVEDAPFIAVEVKSEGAGQARNLAFRLNVGSLVMAGPEHALQMREMAGEAVPYLHVRDGLEARVARAAYYDLAEWALEENPDAPALWSQGVRFALETGS